MIVILTNHIFAKKYIWKNVLFQYYLVRSNCVYCFSIKTVYKRRQMYTSFSSYRTILPDNIRAQVE